MHITVCNIRMIFLGGIPLFTVPMGSVVFDFDDTHVRIFCYFTRHVMGLFDSEVGYS